MKASIYDIRFNLGTKTKIIGYDLGGVTENKEMVFLILEKLFI